jgi:putative transposase
MGQSLIQNYIHIIFSTKNREPFIDESIEEELFDYLGGICNSHNCQSLKVGGYLDHVHILCMLSKNMVLSDFIQKLKGKSSLWIKTIDRKYEGFYWQKGYGAFSVSASKTNAVIAYINDQKLHHTDTSFQDEYRSILKRYGINYDEQYVWE